MGCDINFGEIFYFNSLTLTSSQTTKIIKQVRVFDGTGDKVNLVTVVPSRSTRKIELQRNIRWKKLRFYLYEFGLIATRKSSVSRSFNKSFWFF